MSVLEFFFANPPLFLFLFSFLEFINFEHIELPAKLLDYFLRSNESNINQQCMWVEMDCCGGIVHTMKNVRMWQSGTGVIVTTGAIKGAKVGVSNTEVPTQRLDCSGYDLAREEESAECTNMYLLRSPAPLIDTDKCCPLPPPPCHQGACGLSDPPPCDTQVRACLSSFFLWFGRPKPITGLSGCGGPI